MEKMTAEEYRALIDENRNADGEQVLRNKKSSARGRAFESLLMRGCNYYRQKGIAIINKVNEPYIVTKKTNGNKFMGRFTGRAEPDFKGVLKGGRAIAFEAKSTQKSRIQRNAVTDTQMEWLREQKKMGVVVFVAVNIQEKFYTVPFEAWDNMKKYYGKKFLLHEDIDEFEVIYDGSVRFLEYEDGTKVDIEGV